MKTCMYLLTGALGAGLLGCGVQGLQDPIGEAKQAVTQLCGPSNSLTPYIDVATSPTLSCYVVADGTVWCSGQNLQGQLGNGTFASTAATTLTAVQVLAKQDNGTIAPLANAKRVVVGYYATSSGNPQGPRTHACALLNNGDVYCWGRNVGGELGLGPNDPGGDVPYATKSSASDPTNIAITAGSEHTCVLQSQVAAQPNNYGSNVKCWGWMNAGSTNFWSTLGNSAYSGGSNQPVYQTTLIPPGSPPGTMAVSLSAGEQHVCAVLSNGGRVRCWGFNSNGQLGFGNGSTQDGTPHPEANDVEKFEGQFLYGASEVSLGDFFSCARIGDKVRCWGKRVSMGVGCRSLTGSPWASTGFNPTGGTVVPWATEVCLAPPDSISLGGVAALSRGNGTSRHTCAVRSDGTTLCWGFNQKYQLGRGPSSTAGLDAGAVQSLPATTDLAHTTIATGQDGSCAVLANGERWCWGSRGGGLFGDGSSGPTSQDPQQSAAQIANTGGLLLIGSSSTNQACCQSGISSSGICQGACANNNQCSSGYCDVTGTCQTPTVAWRWSIGGTTAWDDQHRVLTRQPINTTSLGDFDGDHNLDALLAVQNGASYDWYLNRFNTVAAGWTRVCSGAVTSCGAATGVLLGDFDGDGKTDLLRSNGGNWEVMPGSALNPASNATGASWIVWRSGLSTSLSGMAAGDFNGDGCADVLSADGVASWRINYSIKSGAACVTSGSSAWTTPASGYTDGLSALRLGDFDGDGHSDVMKVVGSTWQYSASGTAAWATLNSNAGSYTVNQLAVGQFDSSAPADVFRPDGTQWQLLANPKTNPSSTPWTPLNTSGTGLSSLYFGDCTGDGVTDVLHDSTL